MSSRGTLRCDYAAEEPGRALRDRPDPCLTCAREILHLGVAFLALHVPNADGMLGIEIQARCKDGQEKHTLAVSDEE
jgi:hypothetical protein